MENVVQEIYQLVKKKMREQGAYDRDAYSEFVDEAIDYFYQRGKLSDDENESFIKDQLMAMWEDVADQVANDDEYEV
jgi:hypothetical protein